MEDGNTSHIIGCSSSFYRKRNEKSAHTASHCKTSRTISKRTSEPIGKPKGERDCRTAGGTSRSKEERVEPGEIQGRINTKICENQRLLRQCYRTMWGVNECRSLGCPNRGTTVVP